MSLHLDPPWLAYDLGAPHQVLSWAPYRPGFQTARRILWRQVRNADLPADLDVPRWLAQQLGTQEVVCMLTSRDLRAHSTARACVEGITVEAVATVGLSNSEQVGHRVDRSGRDWDREVAPARFGTINLAVKLGAAMSQTGLLEALSIATQARTAAILTARHPLPDGSGHATGTGTDCIAIAAPPGAQDYAGLHTPLGEALGRAVYTATLAGARDWQATIGPASGG